MNIIVCGGRAYEDHLRVFNILDMLSPTRVAHGNASTRDRVKNKTFGADYFAGVWARQNEIAEEAYKADWNTYGPSAGPIRNGTMLEREIRFGLSMLVAFPGGRGTADMIKRAKKAHTPVLLVDQ